MANGKHNTDSQQLAEQWENKQYARMEVNSRLSPCKQVRNLIAQRWERDREKKREQQAAFSQINVLKY